MQLWTVLLLIPVAYTGRFVGQYPNEVNSQNMSVIYNCTELKKPTEEERRNSSLYPADCRYYCDRRKNATVIQYGYYDVGTPCTNSSDVFDANGHVKYGTCITSGVTGYPIMKCDLSQPPRTEAPIEC